MKEATGQLLDKAERSIEAARLLSAESDYDFAAIWRISSNAPIGFRNTSRMEKKRFAESGSSKTL